MMKLQQTKKENSLKINTSTLNILNFDQPTYQKT